MQVVLHGSMGHQREILLSLFRGGDDPNTYVVPVNPARGIPDLPPGGFTAGAELKADKRVVVVPQLIDAAVGPTNYAYTRQNTRRNIYRIPLPE